MAVQLEPGARIKHYVLDQRLGSGAVGEVWRASDGARTVAMKFMNEPSEANGSASKYRQSLETEIRALRLLQHPNVPALLDYDLDFERPYLVMEYINSMPIDKLIITGEILNVRLVKRLQVLETIAGTISAAHQQGIIHRDIKPANISGIDRPYLMDFSIAVESSQALLSREEVGTAVYMPPLDDGPPDELSDNYSFAVVAYEVLFGKHPIFTPQNVGRTVRETRQLAAERLRQREWRLPSGIPVGELPRDLYGADLPRLDATFQKALGPRRTRYPALLDFVNDLRSAILVPSNHPYLAGPAPLPPAFSSEPLPTAEDYTLHEVHESFRDTDHGRRPAKPRRRIDWVLTGITIFSLLWLIVMLLLLRGS